MMECILKFTAVPAARSGGGITVSAREVDAR
jgi:hypothetical protein